MVIKSFKVFESQSNIESITEDEISSIRDIFDDLVDSGFATDIRVQLFKDMVYKPFNSVKEFHVFGVYKYGINSIRTQEIVDFLNKNALSVSITAPSIDTGGFTPKSLSIINSKINRSISLINLHISNRSTTNSSDRGTILPKGMLRYEIIFLKNLEEIRKINRDF